MGRNLRVAAAGALLLALLGCAAPPDPTGLPGPGSPTGGDGGREVPSVGAAEELGWAVADGSRADVDGDGRQERLLVRSSGAGVRGRPAQVVVATPDLRSVTTLQRQRSPSVADSADLDGRPGDEVLVVADRTGHAVSVLTWREDRLVVLRQPSDRSSGDGAQHAQHWWIEDGRLLQTRSLEAFDLGADGVRTPSSYDVLVVEWRIRGLTLQPRVVDTACVRAPDPALPLPC